MKEYGVINFVPNEELSKFFEEEKIKRENIKEDEILSKIFKFY